jgi:hypothetical protein
MADPFAQKLYVQFWFRREADGPAYSKPPVEIEDVDEAVRGGSSKGALSVWTFRMAAGNVANGMQPSSYTEHYYVEHAGLEINEDTVSTQLGREHTAGEIAAFYKRRISEEVSELTAEVDAYYKVYMDYITAARSGSYQVEEAQAAQNKMQQIRAPFISDRDKQAFDRALADRGWRDEFARLQPTDIITGYNHSYISVRRSNERPSQGSRPQPPPSP